MLHCGSQIFESKVLCDWWLISDDNVLVSSINTLSVVVLLPQILEWLPELEHEDVRSTWPPMKLPKAQDDEDDETWIHIISWLLEIWIVKAVSWYGYWSCHCCVDRNENNWLLFLGCVAGVLSSLTMYVHIHKRRLNSGKRHL